MNYPGNDIVWGYHAQANNVASCQSYCRSTNNKYFTYRRSDGHCWCKSIVTTRTYHNDLDSGEAICGIDPDCTKFDYWESNSNWVVFEDKIYFVSASKKNRADAENKCKSSRDKSPHYGRLAFVDDPVKQQFLTCYIRYRESIGKLSHKSVIIGARTTWPFEYWSDLNIQSNQPGSTKEYQMGWRNWGPGEPNSGTTSTILFADWVFSAENYYWEDSTGISDKKSYVCEKDRALSKVGWTAHAFDHYQCSNCANSIIDSNLGSYWYSRNHYDWIQIDMKQQHHVHRIHLRSTDGTSHIQSYYYLRAVVGNTPMPSDYHHYDYCNSGHVYWTGYSRCHVVRWLHQYGTQCMNLAGGATDQNMWFTCSEEASKITSRYVGIQKYTYPSGCPWNGPDCERWTIREIDVFDHPAKYV